MRQVIRRVVSWFGTRRERVPERHRPLFPEPGPASLPSPLMPRPRSPYGLPHPPVDAGRSPLVRPYLTAYEQQERRTALELALDGVDVGPSIIHGVAVGGGCL